MTAYFYLITPDVLRAFGTFADVILSVYVIFFVIFDVHYGVKYALIDKLWRASTLCKAFALTSYTACMTTIAVLIVRTIDRFVAVVFVFQLQRPSCNMIILILLFVVIISIITSLSSISMSSVMVSGQCFLIDLNDITSATFVSSLMLLLTTLLWIIIACISYPCIWIAYCVSQRKSGQTPRASNFVWWVFIPLIFNLVCFSPVCILIGLSSQKQMVELLGMLLLVIFQFNAAINPWMYYLNLREYITIHVRWMFRSQLKLY